MHANRIFSLFWSISVVGLLIFSDLAWAQRPSDCNALPDPNKLRQVLQSVVKQGQQANGGMGNQRWAVIVDRNGIGCTVVYSGNSLSDQWLGSRMIAAEKAFTANALSLPDYALSTANLYFPSQPGQSLYGLITTAPPNPEVAFGDPTSFGQTNDPIVGKPVGGIVVFGGGLALYTRQGKLVGALGVSGGTSCSDHVIAWKVRHELQLDAVPMGPSPDHNDNMIQDITNGVSASGFGHPVCKGGNPGTDIIKDLSKNFPTGPKR